MSLNQIIDKNTFGCDASYEMENDLQTQINFIVYFVADIFGIKLFDEVTVSLQQVNDFHEESRVKFLFNFEGSNDGNIANPLQAQLYA